jgi:hypothetical protein
LALFPFAQWLDQRRLERELAAANPPLKPAVRFKPAWRPTAAFQSTGKSVHAIFVG